MEFCTTTGKKKSIKFIKKETSYNDKLPVKFYQKEKKLSEFFWKWSYFLGVSILEKYFNF